MLHVCNVVICDMYVVYVLYPIGMVIICSIWIHHCYTILFRVYFSVHIWYIMRRCVFSVFFRGSIYVIPDVIIHPKIDVSKTPQKQVLKTPPKYTPKTTQN